MIRQEKNRILKLKTQRQTIWQSDTAVDGSFIFECLINKKQQWMEKCQMGSQNEWDLLLNWSGFILFPDQVHRIS